MRRGGRILILLGLLLGAITALGSFMILSSATELGRQIPTKPVVVALQPIRARSAITIDAIGVKDWPEAALPPGAQFFEKTEEITNTLALIDIYPGQIILKPMVIDKKQAGEIGTRSNAAFVIPTGKVAMAFGISEITGVAGALQAGDYVDVLLTLQASSLPTQTVRAGTTVAGTEGLPVTQLMLQNVLVLQVGNWTSGTGQGQGDPATSITLALDRQDALALKAAREQGEIDLVLRRAGDTQIVETEPVTLQYLNKRFKFNLLPPITGR